MQSIQYLQKHEEKYIHTLADNEVGAFEEVTTYQMKPKTTGWIYDGFLS